jgi:hypothetical protein
MLNGRSGSALQIDTEKLSKEKVMTIRKSFMPMAYLTSLFLLASAVVPAIASDKLTSGGVTLSTHFTGDHDHGFTLDADYRGTTLDKECKITVTMTLSDKTKKEWPFQFTLSGRDIVQPVDSGEVSGSLAPLTNPEISGDCSDKRR